MIVKSILVLLYCLPLASYGQFTNTVKGSSYVMLKAGVSKFSTPGYLEAGYGYNVRERMSLFGSFGFESGNISDTKFNVGSVQFGVSLNAFSIGEFVYGNLGLGIYGGYESLNSIRDSELGKSSFIVGAKFLAGLECPISESFSLGAEFSQYYDHFSNIGAFHFNGTLNLIYSIK